VVVLASRAASKGRSAFRSTTMNAMEPTYFLYSGRLFHATALPALLAQRRRAAESDSESPLSAASEPSSTPQPRDENPSPEGPEGEPVGEEEDEDEPKTVGEGDDRTSPESRPAPGPGTPVVPEHGAPDANPIDPRVF